MKLGYLIDRSMHYVQEKWWAEYLTTKVRKRIRLRVVCGCETCSFARNAGWIHGNRLLKGTFGPKVTLHRKLHNGKLYVQF